MIPSERGLVDFGQCHPPAFIGVRDMRLVALSAW
jgi:hypothetical protein